MDTIRTRECLNFEPGGEYCQPDEEGFYDHQILPCRFVCQPSLRFNPVKFIVKNELETVKLRFPLLTHIKFTHTLILYIIP